MSTISKHDLFNAIERLLPVDTVDTCWDPDGPLRVALDDTSFYVPTLEEVEAFLEQLDLDTSDNHGEACDCDNIAKELDVEADKYARDDLGLNLEMSLGRADGFFYWAQDGEERHHCNWVYLRGDEFKWIDGKTMECYEKERCRPRSLRALES